jgi:hypothetical protein
MACALHERDKSRSLGSDSIPPFLHNNVLRMHDENQEPAGVVNNRRQRIDALQLGPRKKPYAYPNLSNGSIEHIHINSAA